MHAVIHLRNPPPPGVLELTLVGGRLCGDDVYALPYSLPPTSVVARTSTCLLLTS